MILVCLFAEPEEPKAEENSEAENKANNKKLNEEMKGLRLIQ